MTVGAMVVLGLGVLLVVLRLMNRSPQKEQPGTAPAPADKAETVSAIKDMTSETLSAAGSKETSWPVFGE